MLFNSPDLVKNSSRGVGVQPFSKASIDILRERVVNRDIRYVKC